MQLLRHVFIAGAAAFLLPGTAESQAPASAVALTYADLADLALAAPIAAHVRLKRAMALKAGESGAVPPGRTRFYVEAEVLSLIRGAEGSPALVSYLADVPNHANGKPARPAKKSEYIVLAQAVPGRPGELQLVAPDAQIPFSPDRAAQLRSILREATAAGAPPRITGIGKAFHVPGSLAGESETQIFLQTAAGDPVSLTVLRRPGETPRWAVALGEIVDDAAAEPRPDSLLWYRLACGLPRSLPPQSLGETELGHAGAIAADYRLILERLGPCARSRR
jgi:hypothetical protein